MKKEVLWMAQTYTELKLAQTEFIQSQKLFFVGTAPTLDGKVNVSPKGYNTLRILNSKTLIYVDYYGSGNETANHLNENQRITFMWCGYEETPLILRVYGTGLVIHKDSTEFSGYMSEFFAELEFRIIRQIFLIDIDSVQTSCGWGVPFMNFVEDRSMLEVMSKKHCK
jgi:hypothetical protein